MLLIKTVLILCSATVALAARAVVSGAIFEGVDTTKSSATPHEIYQFPENHAAAAASILTFSANAVNFHPTEQPPKNLVPTLDEFVKKASTFPGLLSTSASDVSISLNGSFTQFEQAIREESGNPLIARAFRDLIPGYNEDKSLTDWTLSLVVISKPEGSDEVAVKFSGVSLTISTDKTHTTYIPKQSTRLILASYKVRGDYLAGNAGKLVNMIQITKVRDFIDFFASPKVIDSERVVIGRGYVTCLKNQQSVMPWLA
ncbi:hypothetical protein BGZ96_004208 [Linnemannia gamsii]|uniref:Uncharacterized protein n=1 Tax=Linnemannia gamsii TaxID=64522 RepID=A0ABQ7KIU5_9FUNG|nr:hypothetical protein BGZ96_004208 [Linnemannia gamsii]